MSDSVVEAVVGASEDRGTNDVYRLGNGARALLLAIPTGLIEEAQARIEYPDPPMWKNPDMDDREEPNPADPFYKRQVEEVDRKRGRAAVDIVLLNGIKLLDEIDTSGEWMEILEFEQELGHIDLSRFDLSRPMVLRYVYLKYAAVSMGDLEEVMKRSRVTQEEYDRAKASFRSN